jgi:membrane protein DedA with SNARE-associated domain
MGVPSIAHLGGWAYGLVFLFAALQSAGVPIPGTTALIAASLYAGTSHHLEIIGLIGAGVSGAIVGNALGFGIGWWGGWKLLERHGWRVKLTQQRLDLARRLFETHGEKIVFLGRFVSGLRTYAAFLAGSSRMRPLRFMLASSLAALIWSISNGLQYYYFGHLLAGADTALTIVLVAAGVGLLVATGAFLRRQARQLARASDETPKPSQQSLR